PGTNRIQAQAKQATAPVNGWSDNWLAYTRYDGVMVTARDLADLAAEGPRTQAILQALWRYAETGGTVVVAGPGDPRLPPTWKRFGRQAGGATAYAVGFGQCLHFAQVDPAKWTDDDWMLARAAFSGTAQPWQRSRTIRDLQETFPVVDDLGVPVRGLFVLMVLFAAVIGPLNLWYLTKLKKRIWLLWTVPAISAVTCLLVMGYTVFGEGWSGHARVGSITLLDQAGERAATLGRTSYYSPLTPSGGLGYPEDAEVTPLGDDHAVFSGTSALEWKGEQHLSRGWITARIPAHFALRRSEASAKKRINLHRNGDGTLSAVNSLGVDLRSLAVADEKGVLYAGGPIRAGSELPLRRQGDDPVAADPLRGWREVYAQKDWSAAKPDDVRAADVLPPLSYLAVAEQSPFLEPGLKGAVRRPSPAVVIGLYSGLGKP
ncbi:MAG: hypothetical protein K2W96_04865, partial [Gemmataceae bacterium]|nr:hypothetical protein [Gemmataceae bacterium]